MSGKRRGEQRNRDQQADPRPLPTCDGDFRSCSRAPRDLTVARDESRFNHASHQSEMAGLHSRRDAKVDAKNAVARSSANNPCVL